MYAILDIETTGGQYNEEGITEIAIYRFDGHEITDQFISLVNPEIPIQPFVVKLTGINSAMLVTAPKFHEVAKRIVEITKDCVIVAHNASFDYRILRTEFRRLGYDFESKTLCTVALAQKLIPDLPSYSLGKLARTLGIPVSDRHRADGDAMATVKLFKMLLEKDVQKEIISTLIRTEIEKGLAPKLYDMVEKLPSRTGLFYFFDQFGKLIYLSKGSNIRKRVNHIFASDSDKSRRLQAETYEVTYELTGSELIASLKEVRELKTLRPKHNRTGQKGGFKWSIVTETDAQGYQLLYVAKRETKNTEILAFTTLSSAKSTLFSLTDAFHLCRVKCRLEDGENACSGYPSRCDGACENKVSPQEYNSRVAALIQEHSFVHRSAVIVDQGRSVSERSAVWIHRGKLMGYAFFDLNFQITNLNVLEKIVSPLEPHADSLPIIANYVRRNPKVRILSAG